MKLAALLPMAALMASSLFLKGQSTVPAELDNTGHYFGNKSLVLKDNSDGTTDTLQVQYHEVVEGDTLLDQSDTPYYWDKDFELRTLPDGVPVSNPRKLDFLKTNLPNRPTEIKRLPTKPLPALRKRILDVSA